METMIKAPDPNAGGGDFSQPVLEIVDPDDCPRLLLLRQSGHLLSLIPPGKHPAKPHAPTGRRTFPVGRGLRHAAQFRVKKAE